MDKQCCPIFCISHVFSHLETGDLGSLFSVSLNTSFCPSKLCISPKLIAWCVSYM